MLCKFVVHVDFRITFRLVIVIKLFSQWAMSNLGGLVAQRLGRWKRDRKVHGSILSRCTTK